MVIMWRLVLVMSVLQARSADDACAMQLRVQKTEVTNLNPANITATQGGHGECRKAPLPKISVLLPVQNPSTVVRAMRSIFDQSVKDVLRASSSGS